MTVAGDPSRLRVLVVHNSYRDRGGEEAVVEAEEALLRADGHAVRRHGAANHAITGITGTLAAAWRATYSEAERDRLMRTLSAWRPDVVHVHNFFPLLSPSVYDACRAAAVPVVQTLHNFRVVCAGATFFRAGNVCQKCVTGSAWWAAWHGCYRGSRAGSAAVARMVAHHRAAGTWSAKVDCFTTPSAFARQMFIEAGLPGDRIVVKPNFVALPPAPPPRPAMGGPALFVGRLAPEKGIATLLAAWSRGLPVPLRVAGTGPMTGSVAEAAAGLTTVEALGLQTPAQVAAEMDRAAFLVVPSTWFETFGLVICEAMARGLPVIASDLGCIPELVEHGVTGLLFRPGDANHLAERVRWATANPGAMAVMAENARARVASRFSPAAGLQDLLGVYRGVLAHYPSWANTADPLKPYAMATCR